MLLFCRSLLCFSLVFLVISLILGYFAYLPIENEAIINRMTSDIEGNMEAFRKLNQTAFVVGYTGEVGKELVKEIARSKIFSNVFLIGRREVTYEDEIFKDFKMEQKIVDYDKLDDHADFFKGHSVGICTLGTTRGKAGKEGFIKVDHDYTMKVAQLAKAGGCQQYHLISSAGANKNSSFLYPRVKGEVEEETHELNFERLSVYRPAVLMCDRNESRPTEWLLRKFLVPMEYLSPGLMTSPTTTVAKAVINTIVAPITEAFQLFDAKTIHRIAYPKEIGKAEESGAESNAGAESKAAAESNAATAEVGEKPTAEDDKAPAEQAAKP